MIKRGLPIRPAISARTLSVCAPIVVAGVCLVNAFGARPFHQPRCGPLDGPVARLTPALKLEAAQAQGDGGDGYPESARLDSVQDRANFTRWFTFLAETQFYAPSAKSHAEIQDCAALVRYAFRNALEAHTPAWRQEAGLPFDPGFGDVTKYNYPHGPLGRALFAAEPGAADGAGKREGSFVEFADSATLLRYNTFLISRDVRAAMPGDLLFFHQSVEREPFHTMLFVGKSHYQPAGSTWIVYHTGDMDGHRGEIREVEVATLLQHPDLHWRPLPNNPNFLGVYRLEILR